MLKHLGQRALAAVPILLLVTMFAFLLIKLVPGDPARTIAGEFASDAQVEKIRDELGLDDPIASRYLDYLGQTARGDFGTSVAVQTGRSVTDVIFQALPTTLSLGAAAIVLAVLVGVPVGVISAVKRDGPLDRILTGLMSLALAIPPFVIGPVMIAVLAINHTIFPAVGYTPISESTSEWLRHLILPGIALGINPAAELARQVRGSLVDELDESYVRTARAKGLRMRRVVGKHALKNAAIPAVTVLGLQVGRVFGGAVVVESIFAMPGVGTLMYRSVISHDFPIVQAIILMTAVGVMVTNLIVDMSYAYFNPRLRK